MDLETALKSLGDAHVEFVIVGGVASILHGSARFTFTLEVCYSRVDVNLRRLVAALLPFHPQPSEFGELEREKRCCGVPGYSSLKPILATSS